MKELGGFLKGGLLNVPEHPMMGLIVDLEYIMLCGLKKNSITGHP